MAFNSKKALALALSAAMIVTAAPMSSFNVEAAAATKAVKGTSKITVSAKKATIKVGAKKTIKVTLNKKQTKALKVTLKSSNAKVAKVAKSVTVKKGKKVASFKITGVKKGTATITASFKTSANKTKKATVKVTVKKAAATKVAVTGVALSTTTPKVGDTITANVTPADATNVASYQWYTGATASLTDAISGATSKDFTVTADQLGKFVGVVVTDTDGKSFTAVSSVAIQDADSKQIAITSAKQSGAKTVAVTFSSAVTASDKLSVKKGNNEVKIDGAVDYAADFTSATITLADRITASSEYTVTLTPADTKVAATEAKFTGETSELKEIKFLNDYLVMKNNDYDEGYAYVKGYDQFGGEVTLSGLTVNAGVGSFKSYDNATGKITIVGPTDQKTPYLLIKEVPVFVQYQVGNSVLTANKTLTVSARSYVSEVEFEDELGKDGTKRDDKKLTVTELGSGKYYVAFKSVKDQYGNELTADDLNTQIKENVLFVIPGKDSGAFYVTGSFGTLNKKTVLWIDKPAGGAKPGTMALTMTGAGGKSFTKDIEVVNDPMIDTLSVVYPEAYAAQRETNSFEFSAVDQYGNALELYDIRPEIVAGTGNKTIAFKDQNGMTNQSTTVTLSGNATFNPVTYDSAKKTFKVTMNVTGKAKDIIVVTYTTANMKVGTQSITVGERGTAAKVKSALKSGTNTQLAGTWTVNGKTYTGDDADLNFNEKVQFEDANGNTMVRGRDNDYPAFVDIAGKNVESTLPKSDSNLWNTGTYAWSLSKTQVKDEKPAANGVEVHTAIAAGAYDATLNPNGVGSHATGKVNYTEFAGKQDYYVTVYLVAGGVYYILDDESFHLTQVSGADKTYKVSVDGSIYADPGSGDDAKVEVTATTNSGENYKIAPSRVKVVKSGDFEGNNNLVVENMSSKLPDNTSGKVTVDVYVDNKPVDSVEVPYSNVRPVATTTKFKYKALQAQVRSLVGADSEDDIDSDEFTTLGAATITAENGKITITNANATGDTFTGYVEDQYGQQMTDTKFYIDGTEMSKISATTLADGERHTVQFANGNQGKKFYMTFSAVPTIKVVSTSTTGVVGVEAKSQVMFDALLANDSVSTITLGANVNAPTTVSKDIVIPAGYTLNTVATTFTGNVTVEGSLTLGGNVTLTGNTISVKDGGVLQDDDTAGFTISGTGKVSLEGGAQLICDNPGGTGNITAISNLEIASGTNLNPAYITAEATGTTVTNLTVKDAGHALLLAGKLNSDTAGTWYIGGTSLDVAPAASVALNTGVTVTDFNLGFNKGTVEVQDETLLKKVIEDETATGNVTPSAPIALTEDLNISSTKGVELVTDNTNKITGTKKIVIAEGSDATIGGNQSTGLPTVANSGSLEITDTAVVTTLETKAGSTTEVGNTATVTSTTGSTGGSITATAGASIGGQTATQTGTISNVSGAVTGNNVTPTVAITVKGGVVTGANTTETHENLVAALNISRGTTNLTTNAVQFVSSGKTDVAACKYVTFANLTSVTTYAVIVAYNGSLYNYSDVSSGATRTSLYEACDDGSDLDNLGSGALFTADWSKTNLEKLTGFYLVLASDKLGVSGGANADIADKSTTAASSLKNVVAKYELGTF